MSVQQEKFTEIADAIRSKTGETDLIKPSDFADKVEDVYDAGKTAEHDAFWDVFQHNGHRVDYRNAFRGTQNKLGGWKNSIFKPKYDIIPTTAEAMFYGAAYLSLDLRPTPFKEQFGVEFDVSNATNLVQWLSDSVIYAVGTIDTTKLSNRLYFIFFSAKNLQIIEKLILPATTEPSMNTTSAFSNCSELTTIEEIEGVIGNGFDIHWSPLDHESIMNIINALADYSDGSYQKTLTLGTTNLAKLTDAEKATATEKGWTLA